MKRRTEYVKCAEEVGAFINAWKAEVENVYAPSGAPVVAANFLWLRRRWHEYDFRAAYVFAFTEPMYVHRGAHVLYARRCEECVPAMPVGSIYYEGEKVRYDVYWEWREAVPSNEYMVLVGPWPKGVPEVPHISRPGASGHRDCAVVDRRGAEEWWARCYERDWECRIIGLKDLVKYAPLIAIGRAMKHQSWLAVKAMQSAVAEALIWAYEHEVGPGVPVAVIVDSIVLPEPLIVRFEDVLIPVKYIPNEWGERYSLAGLIHRKEKDKWRAWVLGQDVIHYKSIEYYYRTILDGLLRSGRPEDYPHYTIAPIMHYFKPVQYKELVPLGKIFKDVEWWWLV